MNDFNSYGKPIDFIPDEIKSGDLVEYLESKNHFEGKKKANVKTPLIGTWDGEKVQFNDKEKTIVRSLQWLTKVKVCPFCKKELI